MTSPPTRRDDLGHGAGFGAYLHIPFCAHRCDYCAFATWTDRGHLVDRYLDAVGREIQRSVEAGLPAPTSIFVGGGTPTSVDPHRLAGLVAALPATPGAEITVECNPESLTGGHVAAYRTAGVNRLSIGVQSMAPAVLQALGRRHDPDRVAHAVDLARRGGIDDINLDVIYGAAGETVADWSATLRAVVDLAPTHVSAYALTVEAGTPLAADRSRHPDDDDQAEKYVIATDVLGEAGYEWYEISNWSRPGRRCRHNLLYWSQGDYRGFGCAAHSHERGRRWWNVRTPDRFIELIERGESAEGGAEELEDEARRLERLQLSLRTAAGVPEDALTDADADALAALIERVDDRVVLTRAGRMLANEVAVRLR
jgi:oxygen-independent coproporphyrinogen-3 oxidase